MNQGIATKAFIVKDNKLLILKRSKEDIQAADCWEIPGGRLDPGEHPELGLKREVKEETNLDIEIQKPLNIQHFKREDNQIITMLIYLCKANNNNINLSIEHSNHEWISIENAKEKLIEFFHKEIDIYKLELDKDV